MNIKFLFLIIFTICYTFTYSQKNSNTKIVEKLLIDSLYNGNVILFEHRRGKLHLRISDYLENKQYKISNIKFLENSSGDFNKNGITDFFATMRIKQRSRNDLYVCLIEFNKNIATIYRYFEMGPYSKLTLKNIKNDTLSLRTEMWDKNNKPYLDRIVSVIHDSQQIIKIVTPSKLDNMKDMTIFKNTLKNIKRESFINNRVIREQSENYKKGDISISSELSGFNDFTLRFTIVKNNLDKNFNKVNFINEMLEFLESNTRFSSILTRIEKVILIKNEDGINISNNFSYDIKNFISPNKYFIIGEYRGKDNYLFDLIYIEDK